MKLEYHDREFIWLWPFTDSFNKSLYRYVYVYGNWGFVEADYLAHIDQTFEHGVKCVASLEIFA